jgi:GalNAc-alpha-(1->4)-GalNAc-alpha-(1->3)-diNAcBac-PP-undecaprenol alpha-1,4-N-acetyl-D-galactosaminyltransferase
MKKKKLCLVIPSLQAGGMERVMSELAGYFISKTYLEIHLILYGISREIFYSIPDGIFIHKPFFRFNNKWRLMYAFKTLLFLRHTIRKIKPDCILSFGEYWNSFVLLALSGLNYPVYISDRCSPEKQFGIIHSWFRKVLYPRANGIIAQTQKAKEIYHKQFGHDNIEVIGNPIREIKSDIHTVRQNVVLMVGRLIKSKHQDKLIELFLNIGMPDWKLVLVGYDHLQQTNSQILKEIIAQHNAENKVLLAGKKADVETYYNSSKIFAFTSSSEGFPNAIGEAMSAGLPAVAFDCVAGPSEMIKDNQNGFLVPLFDYQQFQEKLIILMEHEDIRAHFGEKAQVDIRQFSVANIGDKYLQFILNMNQ